VYLKSIGEGGERALLLLEEQFHFFAYVLGTVSIYVALHKKLRLYCVLKYWKYFYVYSSVLILQALVCEKDIYVQTNMKITKK
jgi:hypothetical protein